MELPACAEKPKSPNQFPKGATAMFMQFTGINVIQLPQPTKSLPAIHWKVAQQAIQPARQPFNGLHLSPALEREVADACVPRRAPQLAYKQPPTAQTQAAPVNSAVPVASAVMADTPVVPVTEAPTTKRVPVVALRQALLQLGVAVTRIAELTHTDRRSAHKHAYATPSSKVKPWLARTEQEQRAAAQAARELLN
jgi:hypothetical protein